MINTITDKEKKSNLVKNILAREREIWSYQVNIDNYKKIISNLKCEWGDDILKYKYYTTEQIVREVPEHKMQLVSDLVFKDQISKLLKSEMLEQSRAKHVYDALVSQIDEEVLEDLVYEELQT